MHLPLWLALVVLRTRVSCREPGMEPTKLYVGGLFELTENWYSRYTPFFVTILKHGFDEIHQRDDILPDFRFEMVVKDTKGIAGIAAKQLMRLAEDDPPKVAIIGPVLSKSLTVTGQIAPFYDLIELSCIATTATTVDRALFPTLFKVNQVSDLLNPLRIKLMKHFGWTRVGTIAYQHVIDISQIVLFHEMLHANNMTLITSGVVTKTSSIKSVISAFKQFDVRIIMGSFPGDIARAIFCEAYRQGLIGEAYVWILGGTSLHQGWNSAREGDCTQDQLYLALDRHLVLKHMIVNEENTPTISGKTSEEEINILKEKIANTTYNFSKFTGWVYDTAWTLALGLNNSIKYLDEVGLSLHDYRPSTDYLQSFMKGLSEVTFMGVSGPVSFDARGSRIGVTLLQRYNRADDTTLHVASYDLVADNFTWVVPESYLWTDDKIPRDRFIYREFHAATSTTAAGIVIGIDIAGTVTSFGFLVFNVYYRKNRSIKMSSPNINNVIVIGCLLMYAEVFVTTFEYLNIYEANSDERICMLRVWLTSLGFTSLFGALFAKTYRVHRMFRSTIVKPKCITDLHLFCMIGVMLVIDLIVLLPWSFVFSFEKIKVAETSKDQFDSNVIYSVVYYYCHNAYKAYWIGMIYIYKGLLLAFGTFLAWETRHVSIPALNDSKSIGACIYNVVIVCLFGVPLAHLLPIEQLTLTFVLESFLMIFCTTICQCIIFLPKVQDRKKIFGQMLIEPARTEVTALSSSYSNRDQDSAMQAINTQKLADIEEENKSLRMKIAQESVAIAKLRKTLLELTGNLHFYKSGTEYILFKRTERSASVMSTL